MPEEDVRERLPDGYEPAGEGMATVELRIVDCRAGALVNASDDEDRVSIPGPWRAAWVGVWLAGAPHVDVPDRVYAWEIFVEGDDPAALWTRAGLAVQEASIDIVSSPWDLHATIRVNGSVVYTVDAPAAKIPWPGPEAAYVPYVNANDGVERSWTLKSVTASALVQQGGGVLEVSGGVLGSFSPASTTGAMPMSASWYPASVQVSPVVADS